VESPSAFAAACAESGALRSLLQLATSPEYAQTRWHTARVGAR
jgi:hypothetical protein